MASSLRCLFSGEWRAGKKHGRGAQNWSDGELYEGEWKAGKEDGRGVYQFASGDVYEGVGR